MLLPEAQDLGEAREPENRSRTPEVDLAEYLDNNLPDTDERMGILFVMFAARASIARAKVA